jgi:hypothetical protein
MFVYTFHLCIHYPLTLEKFMPFITYIMKHCILSNVNKLLFAALALAAAITWAGIRDPSETGPSPRFLEATALGQAR